MSRVIGKRGKRANKRPKQEPKLHSDEDIAYINNLQTAINPAVFTGQSDDQSATQSVEQKRDTFKTNKPFSHLMINDFFDPRFMTCLKKELRDSITYDQKHNDLYNFYQSEDLKGIDSPAIKKARESLYSPEFRSLLESITGISVNELSADVSMSAAVYSDTSRLLCHDDELQGRRIAYILYLVDEPWMEEDGGHLDLFDACLAQPLDQPIKQSTHQAFEGTTEQAWSSPVSFIPNKVSRSYLPKYNTFAFFAVSPVSFHQVREVMVDRAGVKHDPEKPRVRLSISGWFHGEQLERPAEISEQPLVFEQIDQTEQPSNPPINQSLEYWINPDYLKPKTIKQIMTHFEVESSVELIDFLKVERLNECLAEMNCLVDDQWIEKGPAIRRKYYTLLTEQLNQSVNQSNNQSLIQSLYQFLHSPTFASYSQSLTSMLIVSHNSEVRRFTRSCYTLIRDDDPERTCEALDCNLTLFTKVLGSANQVETAASKPAAKKSKKQSSQSKIEWDPTWGGVTHYIAAGAEESLLSLEPVHNTLSLVYRAGCDDESNESNEQGDQDEEDEEEDEEEPGVMRFVDYVNHHAKADRCDFSVVYRVQAEDENDDE